MSIFKQDHVFVTEVVGRPEVIVIVADREKFDRIAAPLTEAVNSLQKILRQESITVSFIYSLPSANALPERQI